MIDMTVAHRTYDARESRRAELSARYPTFARLSRTAQDNVIHEAIRGRSVARAIFNGQMDDTASLEALAARRQECADMLAELERDIATAEAMRDYPALIELRSEHTACQRRMIHLAEHIADREI